MVRIFDDKLRITNEEMQEYLRQADLERYASRKMAYLPSRKCLANERLRNCDISQVLCIKTRLKHFLPV